MERVLVGLAAVALLADGAEHGRADYIFVCQLPGPSSGDEEFPGFDLVGSVFFRSTVDRRTEGGSYLFLTDFNNLNRTPAEPSDPALALVEKIIADNWRNFPTRPSTADGIFLGDSTSLGIGGLQFSNRFSLDASRFGDFAVADAMDAGRETPSSNELHVARFGTSGGDAPSSESNRAAAPFPNATVREKVSDRTLLLVFLAALIVLGTLGYLWRKRRRRLHRALRGPRRTTMYRSPSLPKPPSRRR